MADRPTLYFAHPISTYGNHAERVGLEYLRKLYPNHEILTESSAGRRPNQDETMELAQAADMLVYLTYGDDMIEARIGKEVKKALKLKHEVHEMPARNDGIPCPMVNCVRRLDSERVLTPAVSALRNGR